MNGYTMNGYTENSASEHAIAGHPSAVGSSRLRLTRRGRIVFTTLAAFPLVIAAMAFALNGGMATASSEQGEVIVSEQVTVASGESLWQLAANIAPSEDTREVVAQLLRANGLESADVYPGQQLTVPAQYR